MSALKIHNISKNKHIIKNILKVPSHEDDFEHNIPSSSSSFIRNRLFQPKVKHLKNSASAILNMHLINNNINNHSFSDIKHKTHRNLNKVLRNEKQIKKQIISLIKTNNSVSEFKKVNNEYYSLPLVERPNHKRKSERSNSNHSKDSHIQSMKLKGGTPGGITHQRNNNSFVASSSSSSYVKGNSSFKVNSSSSSSTTSNPINIINQIQYRNARQHNRYSSHYSKAQSVSFDKRDKSHLSYVNFSNNNNNSNSNNSNSNSNSNNTSLSPLIKGKRNNKPNNHSSHSHSLNNNRKSAYISCSDNNKYKSTLLKYSCKSKAGHNITGAIKINQDNYLAKNRIFSYTNFSIFAVFDGHGINGHCVSQFLKEHFSTFFTTKDSFITPIPQQQQHDQLFTEKHIHDKLTNTNFIKQMCSTADERLRKQKFDSKLSGSTGVFVVHIEDKLICYNIGDSRAIYINSNYEPIQITRDHKPNIPEEQKRILNAGGRVAKIQHIANIGPYRVWLKKEDVPGLAMSRSFGDFIAKSVGVINEPEVFEIGIAECKVKAVIIASDGLWEFLSNDTITDIVIPFIVNKDCNGATKKLVDEAFKAWTKDGGVVCDDITIIVLMFDVQE